MTSPSPGFYADPEPGAAGGSQRYWDGTAWTGQVRSSWAPPAVPASPASAPTSAGVVRRRRRGGASVGGVLLALGVLGLVLHYVNGATDGTTASARQVVFSVSGTTSDILVTEDIGGDQTQTDAVSVWSDGPRSVALGTGVGVSATNRQASGSVTCTITVDGTVATTETSSAAYGTAICSVKI